MGRVTRWVRSAVQVFRACIRVPARYQEKYQEKKRKKKRSLRLWLFRRRGKDGSKTSLPRLPSGLSGSDPAISLGESRGVAGGVSKVIANAVSHSSPLAPTSSTGSSESTSADDCYKPYVKCSTVPYMKEGNAPSTDNCHGKDAQSKDQSQVASLTSSGTHIKGESQVASLTSSGTHIKGETQVARPTSTDAHIQGQSQVASVKSSDAHISKQSYVAIFTSSGTHIKDQSQVASPTSTDSHIKDTESHDQIHVPKAFTPTTWDEEKGGAMSNDKSRNCSTTGTPFHVSAADYDNQGKLSKDTFCGSNCERQDIRGATAPTRILNVKFKDKVKVKVMKVRTRQIQKVKKLRISDSLRAQPDKTSPITDDVSFKQDGNLTDVEQSPVSSSSSVCLSDAESEYLRYERSYNELSVHRSDSPVSDISELPFDLEEKPRKEGEHMHYTAHPRALSLVEPETQSNEPGMYTSLSDSNKHQGVDHFLSEQESRGFDVEVPNLPKDCQRYQEQMNPDEGNTLLSSKYESANEEDGHSNHLHSDSMHQVLATSDILKPYIQKQAPTIHHESTVFHNANVSVRESCLHKGKRQDKVSGSVPSTCVTSAQRYGGDFNEKPQIVEDVTKEKRNTEQGKLEKVLESTYYSSALEWANQCYQLGKDETQQLLFDVYGKDYLTRNIPQKSQVSTKETSETSRQKPSYFSSALEWADQCYEIGKDETQQLLFDVYGKDYLTRNIAQKSQVSTKETSETSRQKPSYFSSALEWADQCYQIGKGETQQLLFDVCGKEYMMVGIPQKSETRPHTSLDNNICCTTLECRDHGSMLGKVATNQLLQEVYAINPTKGEIQGHEQSTLEGMPSCLSCSRGLDSALFHASALQWRNQGSNFKTEETRRLLRAVCGHDYLNGETTAMQVRTRSWNKATEELEAAAHKVKTSHPTSSCNTRKIRFSQKNVENRKQSAVCCDPKESGLSVQGLVFSRQKAIVSRDHALSRKQVRPSPGRLSSRPKVRWSERKEKTLQEFSDELDYLEGLHSRRIGGDENFYESKRHRKYETKRKREYQ